MTLGVNVNAMPSEGAVSGAAVTIYVDGNQACSGTSFPVDSIYENNYACDYQLTEPGHIYSWYATATKSGYYDGASETWTFKYVGYYYIGAPVGGHLVSTDKSAILGTYLGMLGLIVAIAVVVTVIIAPATGKKGKS